MGAASCGSWAIHTATACCGLSGFTAIDGLFSLPRVPEMSCAPVHVGGGSTDIRVRSSSDSSPSFGDWEGRRPRDCRLREDVRCHRSPNSRTKDGNFIDAILGLQLRAPPVRGRTRTSQPDPLFGYRT